MCARARAPFLLFYFTATAAACSLVNAPVEYKSGKGEVDHSRWTTPTYVGSLKVTLLPEQLTAVERISEQAVWIPKLKHTHTQNPTCPVFQLG